MKKSPVWKIDGQKEAAFDLQRESFDLKIELAEMLKGGVIMDVRTLDEAKIAEDAGAVAVLATNHLSSDTREDGAVSRMTNPELIEKIQEAVSIPVIAKCRIGHFVEAKILEALFVDFIDESEVLTPADEDHYIDKHQFRIPFIAGCKDLNEALKRIAEGAVLIRTRGEAGSGNISEAVRHLRTMRRQIKALANLDTMELMNEARKLGAPYRLLKQVAETGRLPVPQFAAGGIATPADAALMICLGAESVFVGSVIFSSKQPGVLAKSIVRAVANCYNPESLAEITMGRF
jgi:pyridoxal 5'-phosphate synthase pdxS subunit